MKDVSFLEELEQETGERISACYQCYRCTNSCPVLMDMDILPHRLIRYVILGEREKTLQSGTIWACLQCSTCSIRCPNDIDVALVFDTLRKTAVREGKAKELDTWKFDTFFLESVRRHGRLHEIEAILRYKLEKKNFFEDTRMGIIMMLKGRMGLLPHTIGDRKGMKGMFEKAHKLSAIGSRQSAEKAKKLKADR
jgi:heterodisulfide reductase subunit C2